MYFVNCKERTVPRPWIEGSSAWARAWRPQITTTRKRCKITSSAWISRKGNVFTIWSKFSLFYILILWVVLTSTFYLLVLYTRISRIFVFVVKTVPYIFVPSEVQTGSTSRVGAFASRNVYWRSWRTGYRWW